MKFSILITLTISLALSAEEESDELTIDLSQETTRALLENLSGLPPPIGGPIPEAEHSALREPLTLQLSKEREFTGTLSQVRDGMIYLRIVQEGGEVVLSFPSTEIVAIELPGDEVVASTIEMIQRGELSEALPYLESIIGARYALFPLLPAEDLSFFRALPLAALAVDNPAQAIAYVRAIQPYLTLPEDQRELRDIELLSYYQLQLREEAEERALSWIAEENLFNDSALGFFILSVLEFEKANYEEALDTALRPIVYSGALPKSYLAPCYSIAIASAHLLEDPIERDKLFTEMTERNIPWKPLLVFRSVEKGLLDLVLTDSDGQPITVIVEDDYRENLIDPPEKPTEQGPSLDPSGMIPL